MPPMGRPKLPKNQKRVPYAVKVKPGTPARARAIAKELGMSQGELIDAYVDGPKPTPKHAAP